MFLAACPQHADYLPFVASTGTILIAQLAVVASVGGKELSISDGERTFNLMAEVPHAHDLLRLLSLAIVPCGNRSTYAILKF